MNTPTVILLGFTMLALAVYFALPQVEITQEFDQSRTSIEKLDELFVYGVGIGSNSTSNTVRDATVNMTEAIRIEYAEHVNPISGDAVKEGKN